ncbi:MAG: MotA/TolQ/ExbB proton channel family protein [Paracoccus sp. (in: a-proteobacteria)]|nr:MotA/TolQ/ExbB proton channel family protein [Paracoccus sp. (in: a-proteobacteria)]
MSYTALLNILPQVTALIFAALAILSIVTVAVAIFKITQFGRLGVGRHKLAETILDDWLNGRPDEAQRRAKAEPSVLARVLSAVMSGLRARPADPAYGEELARQTAIVQLSQMNSRMRILDAVVQAAPMLGLLGTVVGMIDAFGNLALTQQVADAQLLASGIWTALTTTAIGLIIALIAFSLAAWLEGRIEDERETIEMVVSAAIHGRAEQTIARR